MAEVIIIEAAGLITGILLGILLCNLLWNNSEEQHIKKELCYLLSGIFMGCAFLCAAQYVGNDLSLNNLVILTGLIFLAVYAIQDMIENAVYAFLLNVGVIGIVLLKSTVYIFECGVTEWFSFFVLSAVVYLSLKVISRQFHSKIGEGDYDILFMIYIVCGNYGTVQVLFISSVAGLMFYGVKLLLKKARLTDKIPLAPILYIGTLAYLGL